MRLPGAERAVIPYQLVDLLGQQYEGQQNGDRHGKAATS